MTKKQNFFFTAKVTKAIIKKEFQKIAKCKTFILQTLICLHFIVKAFVSFAVEKYHIKN
ncbi:hypothetical protein [Kaistella sp.]|uniref:hypothetical protein n=1 Tax=Kaistella sp. TaxID=2782235 RepID=UPI003C5F94E8